MSRPKGIKSKQQHIWTKEERQYLSQITPGRHYREIHKMMNDKFKYQFTYEQVTAAIKRYNLKTGFNGKFTKDHTPWNKGLKGINFGGKETQFKKGHKPLNYRPIGSERVNVEGYIEVKVSDPNKWKLKHRVVYEKHKGKIPKSHAVVFLDGNKLNVDIDNLILVNRKELLQLNKRNLISENPELTKVGVNLVKVIVKTNERKKVDKEEL